MFRTSSGARCVAAGQSSTARTRTASAATSPASPPLGAHGGPGGDGRIFHVTPRTARPKRRRSASSTASEDRAQIMSAPAEGRSTPIRSPACSGTGEAHGYRTGHRRAYVTANLARSIARNRAFRMRSRKSRSWVTSCSASLDSRNQDPRLDSRRSRLATDRVLRRGEWPAAAGLPPGAHRERHGDPRDDVARGASSSRASPPVGENREDQARNRATGGASPCLRGAGARGHRVGALV
jgi:hypothetical protein